MGIWKHLWTIGLHLLLMSTGSQGFGCHKLMCYFCSEYFGCFLWYWFHLIVSVLEPWLCNICLVTQCDAGSVIIWWDAMQCRWHSHMMCMLRTYISSGHMHKHYWVCAAALAVPCMLPEILHMLHSIIEHGPHAQGLFQIYIATPHLFVVVLGWSNVVYHGHKVYKGLFNATHLWSFP